jgi:L-iditol 2-dehydrogenase
MKGLFKTAEGFGNLEIRDTPDPSPIRGQAVIEVRAAGICGSDLHIYHWDTKLPINPPVIIGHELSGVVSEIGEGVTEWAVGERVTVEPSVYVCGSCVYCKTGFYNLCPDRRVMGFWFNGAFTRYVVAPVERLHRLPENVDFHEGALTEPLACCVHGVVELTDISLGDLVVVSGPGTIGLISTQLASAYGGRVVVIGTRQDEERLKKAENLGAAHTLNLDKEDPVAFVKNLTNGLGADVILECSGSQAAVEIGLELVRKQGKYTQIGLFGRPITVDFEKIAYKEIKLTGSLAQRWTAWRKALLLMSEEKVSVKPLISDVYPLSEWKKAFTKFEEKKGLKILLEPGC